MKSKIDYQEILKLIDMLEERNLSHFELELEGFRISVDRGQSPCQPAEIAVQTGAFPASAVSAAQAPLPLEIQDDLNYVSSPMVGTFYRSPDPSSDAFIEVGETVKKNQTLCIIEAMKLMNEIEAEQDGVVQEIFVKNGNPVEYGQKLFAIKPQ